MSGNLLPRNVKPSENVLFQQIGNECVLLNMETEQYFGLDEVGARVWQIITENGDTHNVIELLKSEYEITEANLQNDLSALLTELEKENLIIVEK